MQNQNPAIERYYAKKKKRKQRTKYMFYTLLVILSVTVITVLSLTVFFNISDIAVTGNSYYKTDQIISASGLYEGQNLFRLNKFKIIDNLKRKLPYIKEVTIDRHLPVGIEIVIAETSPFMCIEANGGFYLVDQDLKVLEKVDAVPENLPVIAGVEEVDATIGQAVTGSGTAFENLSKLAPALKSEIGTVTDIDLSLSYDVTFVYDSKVTVKLGTLELLKEKLALVKYVLDENRSSEYAEVDVSSGNRAYYRSINPEEEQENDTIQPEDSIETSPENETAEAEE